MTKQRTFIVSAVVTGCLSFGWAAHAGFPWLRVPAAACVAETATGGATVRRATIDSMAVSNTDLVMICPITTDTPDQYNRFNVHFMDNNSQRSVTANACVDFFGSAGGACFGEKALSSNSFITPSGSVTQAAYPGFDTWVNNFGDFPFIRVKLPARQNCSGHACFPASSLRGLFVFNDQ
jgi:hypothetical protein